jgi:hypothetical protein
MSNKKENNALKAYYKQEEKKGFKDWTKGGLIFLLNVKVNSLTKVQEKIARDRLETM